MVQRRLEFGRGDLLRCDFDFTYSDGERARPTGVVHKVHKHIPLPPPNTLFGDDAD